MPIPDDLYCKLFVDTSSPREALVHRLAHLTEGTVSGYSVASNHVELDVRRNEDAATAAERRGSDTFLYFPFYLDVTPAGAATREGYIGRAAREGQPLRRCSTLETLAPACCNLRERTSGGHLAGGGQRAPLAFDATRVRRDHGVRPRRRRRMSVLPVTSDRFPARRMTMTLLVGALLGGGCEAPTIDPGDNIGDMSKARCATPCDCVDRGPPDYKLETAGRKTPNGDEQQQAAIVWANHFRTAVGLKALNGNDLIEKAASAHASYLAMAKGACDVGAHNEKAGCPGFTGADPGARITAAGYRSSTWGEVVFSSGASGETAVAWWVFSVYHRLPFVDYRLLEMGAGHESAFVVDFGTASDESGKKPSEPVVFPPPGAIGIPPVFDGNSEGPRPPPPPTTGKWPAGVPISIHFNGDSYTLTEHHLYASGLGTCTEVPHAFFDGTSDPNLGNFSPSSAFFYADLPMQGGTEYVMSVKGTAAGQPYSRAWAFTTR